MSDDQPAGVAAVNAFLRGQNLEQIGKEDEAVALYEEAVAAGFDAPGPYDRLIIIYSNRAAHADVVRVVEEALTHVHTHDDKRSWFTRMRDDAHSASRKVQAAPKKPE